MRETMYMKMIVNTFFLILIMFSCSLLSCSNGLNDVYEKNDENENTGLRVIYDVSDYYSGGTLPEDPNYYKEGDIVTVLSSSSDTYGNLYYEDGVMAYRCSGWSDGNNIYTEGSTFVMGNSDVTLLAQWTPYAVGDEGPGKGIIYYDKTYYSDDWRYLEAAPSLWYDSNGDGIADTGDPMIVFMPSLPLIANSYLGDIGNGFEETHSLFTEASDALAALACVYGCRVGGKNDWYLPSRDELSFMLNNYSLTAMITGPTMYYWSSTAIYNTTNAYICYWDGSVTPQPNGINNSCYVRPGRRF